MSHVIALVDDDRNILTSVSIALQAEGFITRVYADGQAALKAFGQNAPDLGVFDIKMPQMDGMELLRRMREMGGAIGAMHSFGERGPELNRELARRLGLGANVVPSRAAADHCQTASAPSAITIGTKGRNAGARCFRAARAHRMIGPPSSEPSRAALFPIAVWKISAMVPPAA